jgi:hypothetical protein
VPPATRPKRLLALALGIAGLATAMDGLGAALGRLPFTAPSVYEGNAFLLTAVALAPFYVTLLGLFLLTYPTPARGRLALPGLLAVGLSGAGAFLWLFDRAAMMAGPIVSSNRTLLWRTTLGEAWTAAMLLAVLAALWRVRLLPPEERRGALLLLTAVGLSAGMTRFGGLAADALLYATGTLRGVWQNALSGAVPGDCCGLSAAYWLAAYAVASPLLVAAFAWRERWWLPAILVGAQFLLGFLDQTEAFLVDVLAVAINLLLFVALAREGSLDMRAMPARAVHVGAALVGFYVFLQVVSLTIANAPDFPLAVPLGVIAGLGLGALAVAAVLPPDRGLAAVLARPAESEATAGRRLGPYAIALDRELAAGARPEEAAERLRALRGSLRVSDREHAALVFARQRAVRGPTGAGGDFAPGSLFLDRYRVTRDLRAGGMGVTRLCWDERMDRPVVIKSLRSAVGAAEGVEEVLREARALGKVRHPGIVAVHDVERVGDEAFIIMEHVEGGSLQERLDQGPLDPAQFRRVAHGLLDALGAVHDAGLVHRDVKPSNVLLTLGGEAKLADFGVAHIPGYETTAGAPDAGAVGTVRYMSPEQARGRGVSPRSDLFSAAATLFEAWTGRPYLEAAPGESAVELQFRAASAGPFRREIDGPEALRAWFARALDPRPERRFARAGDMRAALEAALGP